MQALPELRAKLLLAHTECSFCTDDNLMRYLLYFPGKLDKAHASLAMTLDWRTARGFDVPSPPRAHARACRHFSQTDGNHCFFSIGQDK